MLIIKLLSGLSFFGSIAWFITIPGYEPAIAIATSLSALIAAWITDKKQKRQAKQTQIVAQNGIGIQAGGNVSTGDIHTRGNTTDAE
jgi:hypothetical protein